MSKEQKKAEKKARMKAFQQQIKAMSDEELQEIVRQHCAIVTIEGHSLSYKNSVLCILQHNKCSVVGGFQQWKRAGRVVKKGELGILIFIPCVKKSDDGVEDEESLWFSCANVFDISQTQELDRGSTQGASL